MYFSALMNESFKTQQKVLNYAQKHNIHIAYNPSLYIVNQGMHRLRNILKNTNILIFNKEEAQALLRDSTDNMFNLLYGVLKLGPKIIAITDGHNGVHCYNSYDEYVYSAKPHKVKVMETTGAGDAFGAGFVAGIIMGKDVSFSIKLGMLNAESLISGLGAKTKLLDTRAYAMAEHDHRTIFKKKL